MNCGLCKWELAPEYVRYKDINGNPYCQECYKIIGGQILMKDGKPSTVYGLKVRQTRWFNVSKKNV